MFFFSPHYIIFIYFIYFCFLFFIYFFLLQLDFYISQYMHRGWMYLLLREYGIVERSGSTTGYH